MKKRLKLFGIGSDRYCDGGMRRVSYIFLLCFMLKKTRADS